jgi:hypothetical protein
MQRLSLCNIFNSINIKQILLALMGVLTPGSAHARPSALSPIDTTFFARVWEGGGVINFLAISGMLNTPLGLPSPWAKKSVHMFKHIFTLAFNMFMPL